MTTTRRVFLLTLPAIGFTLTLPWGVKRPEVQRYLTMRFNEFCKGTGTKHWPVEIQAGRDLFDKYEGSLQAYQRFVLTEPSNKASESNWGASAKLDHPALMFKCSKMYREAHSGWGLTLTDKTGRTMTWRDEDARL